MLLWDLAMPGLPLLVPGFSLDVGAGITEEMMVPFLVTWPGDDPVSWFKIRIFRHSCYGIQSHFGVPRTPHLSSQAVKGCLAGGRTH